MISAEITVRLNIAVDAVTPQLTAALEDLAAVMMVQAEDGVWTGGNPDAEDAFQVADLVSGPDAMSTTVTVPAAAPALIWCAATTGGAGHPAIGRYRGVPICAGCADGAGVEVEPL